MKTTTRLKFSIVILFFGYFILLVIINLIGESSDSEINFQDIVKNIPYFLIASLLFTIITYLISYKKNKSQIP